MDIIFIIVSVFFILLIFVLVNTLQQKGKWGVNLDAPLCPKCKEKLPILREPKSAKQFLWGGWTCHRCGCEVDKWGKEIQKA